MRTLDFVSALVHNRWLLPTTIPIRGLPAAELWC